MLASRVAKPKLSLSINTAVQPARPTLALKSPSIRAPPSPLCHSPAPLSPTVRNTRLNQYSTTSSNSRYAATQPTYAYANSSTARSILKKGSRDTATKRSLSWDEKPTVYCVTPIEEPDYYGESKRMSRDERRWTKRS